MQLSNNLIFYDTETTGLIKDFAQILQCGSIQANRNLEIQDEQNLGCAPLPWAIPHPMACLLYTSPSPRDVEESRMPSSA